MRLIRRIPYDNERQLEKMGIQAIQLPRPAGTLDAPKEKTPGPIRQLLHDRRAGIEPLIGHTKHGGQMGRSRMKSDQTTLAAGYASLFAFNLRQLVRNLMGEVCPKVEKMRQIAANDADNDQVKAALSVAKDLVMTKVRA